METLLLTLLMVAVFAVIAKSNKEVAAPACQTPRSKAPAPV